MKRKSLAVLLALCMVFSMFPAAAAASTPGYGDVDEHWAKEAIDRWSGHGVVEGSNGLFEPDQNLTRAQLAAIISRLLNLRPAQSAGFDDVAADAWYADYIDRCAAAGIMQGSGGAARPNDPVTREETMVMLGRALHIQPMDAKALSDFGDQADVSAWAAGYVAALTDGGIVNGVSGNLLPQANIDRASTVTILHRAITGYANEAGQRVEAKGGIVIVAAPNVTVSGTADSVLVAPGADGGAVTLSGTQVSGAVTVTAESADVELTGDSSAARLTLTEEAEGSRLAVDKTAQAGDITVEAPKAVIELSGKADAIATTETAASARVEVAKNAAVGEIAAAGEKTQVSVSGKVDTVTVADTAAGTSVEANRGAAITTVDNAAENVSVSGSGKVESVTTSGNNTSVDTKGTKVEAAEGTTGTTAGSKDVAGGQSVTTPKPSTGGSSSHSHSYAYADNGNGTHTGTCSCGAAVTAAHNTDGAEGSCSVCGAKVPEHAVASIVSTSGITYYTTLKAALEAAGGTVTLLADTSIVNADLETVITGKSLCVDLNEKKLTLDDGNSIKLQKAEAAVTDLTFQNGSILANAFTSPTGAVFHILSGCSITLDKVTVETGASVLYPSGDAASVTVQNGSQIHTKGTYAVATNAGKVENYNVVITLKDSSLSAHVPTANYGCAVCINVPGTLNIENCTIESDMQGVFARAGTVSIKDSTLKTTGAYSSETYGDSSVCWKDRAWGGGDCAPVAALTMGSYVESGGGAGSYSADAVVTLDKVDFVAPENISTIYIDSNDTYAARLNGVPGSQLALIDYGQNLGNIHVNGNKLGSAENPYPIYTEAQFKAIGTDKDAYYRLENDLALSVENKVYDNYFMAVLPVASGHLDGNGKTLTVTPTAGAASAKYNSLFFLSKDLVVKNLTVENTTAHNMSVVSYAMGDLLTLENVTFNNQNLQECDGNSATMVIYMQMNANGTLTMDGCVNNASLNGTGYNAIFFGQKMFQTVDGQRVNQPGTLIFKNCVNNGSLSCDNAALFIANSTRVDSNLKVQFENNQNTGTIRGTKTVDFAVARPNASDQSVKPSEYIAGLNASAQSSLVNSGQDLFQVAYEDSALSISVDADTRQISFHKGSLDNIAYYVVSSGVYTKLYNDKDAYTGTWLRFVSREIQASDVTTDTFESGMYGYGFTDDVNAAATEDGYGNKIVEKENVTYYLLDHTNGSYLNTPGTPTYGVSPSIIQVQEFDAQGVLLSSAVYSSSL